MTNSSAPHQVQQVLFVDPRVQDYSVLLEGLSNHYKVFVLNSGEIGAVQISQQLRQLQQQMPASAASAWSVHILCHGAPGCLYLGAGELSLSTLEQSAEALSRWFPDNGAGHELLLYGCNVAVGDAGEEFLTKLQGWTGAAIAASTTPIGCTSQGGNWELDTVRGHVKSEIAIAPTAQATYAAVLDPSNIELAIAYDGTPGFDGDDNPGNDSSSNNNIIRVHDEVGFSWNYNTNASGATNPKLTSVLPEGMRWTGLPPQASGPDSGIYDGAAYEADGSLVAGGDGRVMLVHLADIPGTTSVALATTATVTGEVAHDDTLNGITVSFGSDELTTPLVSSEDISLTVSAAPSTNIKLESTRFRGLWNDETGVRGAVYQVDISLLGAHPTRSGADGIKGAAELEPNLTFDLDLSGFGDNARLFNFIPNDQTNIDIFGGDGATRNYEKFNGVNVFASTLEPAGRIGERGAAYDSTRATPDSGDWTASQTAPGAPINVTLLNVDTTGSTFPTRRADNGALPADEEFFAAGQVFVWIPIDDVRAGDDGILGNADDGTRDLTLEITNFDPNDASGTISNFGTDVENASDNDKTFTASAGVGPGVVGLYRKPGNWGVIPTATAHYAGDAAGVTGQSIEHAVYLGTNTGLEPIENVVLAGIIDNTAQKVIPSTMPGTWRPNNWNWSVLREIQADNTNVYLEHGVDYVVEFGTGGQGGDAGWSNWDEMDDATAEDTDTSTV